MQLIFASENINYQRKHYFFLNKYPGVGKSHFVAAKLVNKQGTHHTSLVAWSMPN
jgi:hypothetical protein